MYRFILDLFPENKLHKIFPDLRWCPWTNRKEETVGPRAHWLFFYYSFLFIERWGTASLHQMWSTYNCKTYLFRSHWNKREPLYSSVTMCFIWRSVNEKDFQLSESSKYFWKDLNFKNFLDMCFNHLLSLLFFFKSVYVSVLACTHF